MQGTNNSRIGMRNSRRGFDDDNWGYGKKNTRGSKAKGSKTQGYQQGRKNKQKNVSEYFTQ
jgi:hypothetical protein